MDTPLRWPDTAFVQPPEADLSTLAVDTQWVRLMKYAMPLPELDQVVGLPVTVGLLFWGPAGTGKHTLARAMGATAAARGYRFAHCRGTDFSGLDSREISRQAEALFHRLQAEQPAFLLAEELSGGPAGTAEAVAQCFGQALGTPLFLVAVEADPAAVESLARVLYPCRFTLPTERERGDFYREALQVTGLPLAPGLGPEDLAKAAGELQFRQMEQTVYLFLLTLKAKALTAYGRDAGRVAEELAAGKLCLNLADFRDIVAWVKTPEAQVTPPPVIFQTPPAVTAQDNPPAAEESKTDKAKKASTMSELFDLLG